MKLRKLAAISLCAAMTAGLAGCGGGGQETTAANAPASDAAAESTTAAEGDTTASADATAITLWTYPVGSWTDASVVDGIVANFNKVHPEISVKVEYLDYTSGDDQVTAAIEAGTTPDIILEGPERLVSNWGAAGKLVDLADLWTEDAQADITAVSEAVMNACKSPEGVFYEYPLCMNAHCMAINKELFEAADAMQYIDEETRTWTTEDFGKALQALKDSGVDTTGVVYCGGQGGDQGTRALVRNLYSASFTNADHTEWTMNSEAGIKGLQQLVDWTNQGILSYDAGAVASDELQLFANGTIAMTFCWNASNENQYASQVAFTPYAMTFPSDDGTPDLDGGIYGFGIFNNGDETRIEAAKEFIRFVCDDPTQGPASVQATGFFPVRESFGNVYEGTEDEERMSVFASFMPYLGDYYNVTPGWTEQRTAWWNMLQGVFGGADVTETVNSYADTCNAATQAAMAK